MERGTGGEVLDQQRADPFPLAERDRIGVDAVGDLVGDDVVAEEMRVRDLRLERDHAQRGVTEGRVDRVDADVRTYVHEEVAVPQVTVDPVEGLGLLLLVRHPAVVGDPVLDPQGEAETPRSDCATRCKGGDERPARAQDAIGETTETPHEPAATSGRPRTKAA